MIDFTYFVVRCRESTITALSSFVFSPITLTATLFELGNMDENPSEISQVSTRFMPFVVAAARGGGALKNYRKNILVLSFIKVVNALHRHRDLPIMLFSFF